MAHPQQLQFVKSIAKALAGDYSSRKVLEIGSYDVNGSVRNFFLGAEYLGVDLVAGPGVDLVSEGHLIQGHEKVYDIAISCECFEHNPYWVETFENMYRMTKDGGVVLFTCATTGRPEHGTTRTSPKASPGTQALNWDYYKNLTENDFINSIQLSSLFGSHFFLVNYKSCDLYFLGFKGKGNSLFSSDVADLKRISLEDQQELQLIIDERKKRERFIPKPLRKSVRRLFGWGYDNSRTDRLIDPS